MVARKPIVGANWKSNPAKLSACDDLINSWNGAGFDEGKVEVVVGATAVHIANAKSKFDPKFKVAAQNCSKTGEGAFTGEITASMLTDLGLEWVIIGHSERRHKFGESNEDIAEKIGKAQEAGLKVLFCIGELLEEREAGKTNEVCETQVKAVVSKVTDWSKIVIAYEPVWAIGTGVVATVEQAQEAHAAVRKVLADNVSAEVAASTRIQYGGSVSPDNCEELIKCPDIDGFLVGGASLKPTFMDIIGKVQASC